MDQAGTLLSLMREGGSEPLGGTHSASSWSIPTDDTAGSAVAPDRAPRRIDSAGKAPILAGRGPGRRDARTTMEGAEPQERRGRRGRAERAIAERAAAPPKAQPRLPFAPVAIVSGDELEAIHEASLTILSEIGMDFLHQDAKAILKRAGADVDPASDRVRFDKALVESVVGLAPRRFTLHARNPLRSVAIGGDAVAFCSVASAPNSADREGGRRPGALADFRNFLRLGQSLDMVHVWGGYPVEPVDVHASVRHLDALFDMLTLSDKPIHEFFGRQADLLLASATAIIERGALP